VCLCVCALVLFTCKLSKTASMQSEVNSKEEVIAHKGMSVCVCFSVQQYVECVHGVVCFTAPQSWHRCQKKVCN